jgi:hypothetical protein
MEKPPLRFSLAALETTGAAELLKCGCRQKMDASETFWYHY